MKTIITSLGISLFLMGAVNAQNKTKIAINNFAESSKAKVSMNKSTGTPKFIRFSKDEPLAIEGATAKDKVLNFLKSNTTMFGLENILDEMKLKQTITDKYGLKQTTLQQQYKGVPVFDGVLRFHFNKENNITSINGNVVPVNNLQVQPKLTKAEAATIAVNSIKNQNLGYTGNTNYTNRSQLFIYQKGLIQGIPGKPCLAYQVEVTNNADVREFVYVNAHNGKIIEQYTGVAHALNREVYQGFNPPVLVWQEGDAYPGALNLWQRNEVMTSGHVYNFFKNAFGRDSYDNKGGVMRTINISDTLSFCPNAFWNGESTYYCEGAAADDVVAHEWGHAYTQYTSGLIYAYQSGALNESYSDIWGETIDLLNAYEDDDEDLSKRKGCNSSDRWKMGEDATAFGEAIRDLWEPSCKAITDNINYPDNISEYLCLGPNIDKGGVHINSSIPNHAYALLVDGGYYNGMYILGIGFTKAAHIFWRAQSEYLTKTSDFEDFANALQASAIDLQGINLEGLSLTDTPAGLSGERIGIVDILQLEKAIHAVGLRKDIDFCGFEPILSPIEPLCDNAKNAPIYKQDWENGLNGWGVAQLPSNPKTWEARDWEVSSSLPDSREGKGIFAVNPVNGDCQADLQNGILRLESPSITISGAAAGDYEMAFNHYVETEASWDNDVNEILYWDGGNIKYSVNEGEWLLVPLSAFLENGYNAVLAESDNPLTKQPAFAGIDEGTNTGSWGTSVINLSKLGVVANDTVKFRFELGTDGCNGLTGWYIDEMMVYACENKDSVLSSQKSSLSEFVSVSPNPSSSGVFNLSTRTNVNLLKAEVYDLNGRLITSVDLTSNSSSVNLSAAAKGVYFMSVYADAEKSVFKIVKN